MMKAINEQQSTSLKSGTFVVVVGVKKHNRIAQPRCKVVHVKFSISSGDSDFISGPFSWWCRIKLHKYFVFTTSAKLDLLQSSTHNGWREYRPFSSCLGLTADCLRTVALDGWGCGLCRSKDNVLRVWPDASRRFSAAPDRGSGPYLALGCGWQICDMAITTKQCTFGLVRGRDETGPCQ